MSTKLRAIVCTTGNLHGKFRYCHYYFHANTRSQLLFEYIFPPYLCTEIFQRNFHVVLGEPM